VSLCVAELDGNPEYEKMISEAEQRRLSRGSADGSTGFPLDAHTIDNSNDFVNKVSVVTYLVHVSFYGRKIM
jgi:hypothetical protein